VLQFGKKLNLILLATINLKAACSAQPAILPKHLNFVNMAAFQFYLQLRKQRKVVWVEDDIHVVFGQKLPGEK
jgi:hypothetical protein